MNLAFDRPEFLWLALLAVPIVALVFRSQRRVSRRRMATALALRLALLAALVASLSELTLRRPVDDLGVVFVLDRSASVGSAGRADALEFVRQAVTHQERNDTAGVVVFGADAAVEREVQHSLELASVESTPSPHQSDLAAGLRLGTALLPADRTRRLVLLSDGEQTRGDAAAQVLLTATDDLKISVVEVGRRGGPEALLEDVLAPARVDQGAAYEVRVVARAGTDTTGTLRLYRNDAYLGEMPVTLVAGRARILAFRQQATEPGLVRYRATLEVDEADDSQPENNQVVTTVQVSGRPKVLVVARDPERMRHLVTVLQGEGLTVDLVDIGNLPPELSRLRPYEAVFLSDVPAYQVPKPTQRALQAYVRDLGRGLVMLGGDQSFGLGGWYRTPVEDALPVRMDIEDKTQFPKLAMVLAVDKSCSMGGGAGSKLGMAKEAAIQSAELLSERDLLGIISFDGASSWVSPLADLTDRQRVFDDIEALRSGGGTDIYPAVDNGIKALVDSDAALKHLIVLSDGHTSPGAYEPLIRGAHNGDGITVSTVSIGAGSDVQLMKDLARWGGGNAYTVTDKHAIPAIFTRETLLATRSFLLEEPFVPAVASPSELTRGLDGVAWAELGGFVATEPKSRAIVALTGPGPGADAKPLPLLAHWRYGLGRSAAFTSDAHDRWGAQWVGSPSYVRLWTQMARWLVAGAEDDNLSVETEIRDGTLTVTVDAFDASGGFRNFLQGDARVVAPDLQVHPLDLQQVAPGRYEAVLPIDQDGSWLVGVQLSDGDDLVGQTVAEAVQPYSPEYRAKGAGSAILTKVARVGRGGQLTDPAEVFARPEVARTVPRPLWPPLMALAAMILLLDVAARRLALSRGPGAQNMVRPASTPPKLPWRAAPKGPRGVRDAAAVEDADDPGAGDAPPPLEVPEDSYAGRLLAARRAARRKLDNDD